MVQAITGGCYGDEGKGKITDLLASKADYVVRFQGGANAGHTVINEYGKFVLHLLPSGVFHGHTVNLLASGVAFDADAFFSELTMLKERGIPTPNVLVSSHVHILLPIHKLQDRLEEERLGKHAFGSTLSGISPFYADKYAKRNFRIAELYEDGLKEKIVRFCEDKNTFFRAFYGVENAITISELTEYLLLLRERLRPFLCDAVSVLQEAIKNGKRILLEGQLGSLRDVENGIYPYVTSSSPLAGFASAAAGIPPYEIRAITSVVKAYSTCVGAGPFVGELFGEQADELRRRGGDSGEFGATTGRPRRMAWFDCVAARYGCTLQGATEVTLTMLDVLGYLERIPVCIAYTIDGQLTDRFPETHLLCRAEPVYAYLDGWRCDISKISKYEELPEEARRYVEFVEKQIGFPISMISVGPERNQTIFRTTALVNKAKL